MGIEPHDPRIVYTYIDVTCLFPFRFAPGAGIILRPIRHGASSGVYSLGAKMSEATITESKILDALRSVMDPDLRRDIVSLNFIRNMKIEGGTVSFDVNLTTPACPVKDRLREQSRQAVLDRVPGVKDVRVNMTAEVRRPPAPETGRIKGGKNIVAV